MLVNCKLLYYLEISIICRHNYFYIIAKLMDASFVCNVKFMKKVFSIEIFSMTLRWPEWYFRMSRNVVILLLITIETLSYPFLYQGVLKPAYYVTRFCA